VRGRGVRRYATIPIVAWRSYSSAASNASIPRFAQLGDSPLSHRRVTRSWRGNVGAPLWFHRALLAASSYANRPLFHPRFYRLRNSMAHSFLALPRMSLSGGLARADDHWSQPMPGNGRRNRSPFDILIYGLSVVRHYPPGHLPIGYWVEVHDLYFDRRFCLSICFRPICWTIRFSGIGASAVRARNFE